MHGVMWTIPRAVFQRLGGRLTDSLAVRFIYQGIAGKSDLKIIWIPLGNRELGQAQSSITMDFLMVAWLCAVQNSDPPSKSVHHSRAIGKEKPQVRVFLCDAIEVSWWVGCKDGTIG